MAPVALVKGINSECYITATGTLEFSSKEYGPYQVVGCFGKEQLMPRFL